MRVLHLFLATVLLFSTAVYANDSKMQDSISVSSKQSKNNKAKNAKLLLEEKMLEHTFSHSGGMIYNENYWDKIVKRVVKASIKSIKERDDLKDRSIWVEAYNTDMQKGVFFEHFEKKLKTELVSRGYHVARENKNNTILLSYGIDVSPAVSMIKKWDILFTANIVAQNHYVMHITDSFIVTNNSVALYMPNVELMLPTRNIATRRISIIGK